MEKVPRWATKMISDCKGLSYEERLDMLKLTTLETRRIRANLLEVFKIGNDMEGLKFENFFERAKDTGTRGNSFKLFKKRVKTNFGKYSFGNRVVTEWNDLPENVVNAGTINNSRS